MQWQVSGTMILELAKDIWKRQVGVRDQIPRRLVFIGLAKVGKLLPAGVAATETASITNRIG
jgi:hypothetical protein